MGEEEKYSIAIFFLSKIQVQRIFADLILPFELNWIDHVRLDSFWLRLLKNSVISKIHLVKFKIFEWFCEPILFQNSNKSNDGLILN